MSRAILLAMTAVLAACGGDDKATNPATDLVNQPNREGGASSQVITTSSAPALIASSIAATSSAQNIALEKDTTPPSSTQLLLQKLTQTSITLAWDDATDDARINTYKIQRNGQLVATLSYPVHVFTDIDLQPYTAYTYTIIAVDSSGNDSKASSPYTVRTLSNSSSSKASAAIDTPTTAAPPSTAVTNSVASANSSYATSSKATSNAGSSVKSSSSKAASKPASSSRNSSSKASSSKSNIASSAAAAKPNTVKITWSHPQQRENGQFLELQEIGGYEIRYRNPADGTYSTITVANNATNEYSIENAEGLEFEIAAFDINGIYSQFVKVAQ
ncbi:MAG TPA: fibronectin type III domain-containing protein [Cellvibrio sp.]|nr:fibronectin type III domain-containing protein [Cellvibrio sp.]